MGINRKPSYPPSGGTSFWPSTRPVYRGGAAYPLSLFALGTTGAWFDISDLSTLYQTNDTSTPVTALGQQVGRVTDKSGSGAHATQATAANRPTLPAAGYRLRSDFSNDVLSCTLASARDMYVSTPYGAYKSQANAGAVRLPLNDATEIVACATLSAAQEDALYRYFGVDEKYLVLLSSDTTINNMRCYTGGGTTNILFVGANGVTVTKGLSLNSDTSYDVSTDGLTAPVAVVYPSGLITSTALTYFACHTNQLTGSIPSLTANTALVQFQCHTNQLTGSIPSLTANTALTTFTCYNNQLTGSIPSLTANTALQQFYCHINQLTGSIPSLTANTELTIFYCQTNQLTGWTGGTVSETLGDFRAQDNLLTQAAVDAILAAFVAANRTTGTRILNLGGTGNAAPSAAGVTDKNTLISRGWTVTTN